MVWEALLLVGLAVLLFSNIWLLREVDRLQGRLEHYVAAVRLLDDRIHRLAMEVDDGYEDQHEVVARAQPDREP